MMDMTRIRQSSWEIAAQLGYPRNDALPVLEEVRTSRTKDEFVNRIFAMLCTAGSAHRFDRGKALAWLEREGGTELLAQDEHDLLNGSEIEATPFIDQIEGMWALCWCLKIVPELNLAITLNMGRRSVQDLLDVASQKTGTPLTIDAPLAAAVPMFSSYSFVNMPANQVMDQIAYHSIVDGRPAVQPHRPAEPIGHVRLVVHVQCLVHGRADVVGLAAAIRLPDSSPARD